MTTTITCHYCGSTIRECFELQDHVTCTPQAPSPQAPQDAEQAFQVMQEEFLEVQRTLQQAHRDHGRR